MPKTALTADQMSPTQARELQSLCARTGERVEGRLTVEQAECRIETLRLLHTLPAG